MARCATCSAENRDGVKFCGECGAPMAMLCPACGTPNEAGRKFCGECGAALLAAPAAVQVEAPPAAERRLVSVLFADLVGFTPLSESRDPEEVRELLSRYFDSCRRLVELYGGVVEKFIGDAVMAVWGTPVAQEDDAERAVRASLDLVAAVSALGDEVGAPDLRARAGVLTGEAAVNLAATGEGMVAGDLVNTAARIQSAAEPGTVLVGESTRRASEQAIAFEDAGAHALKGKAEPVALWRAVRVTAARGGALRSEGLEAPFVGRERELRLVKELFHASAEQSRAQLVRVTGIAGIGKSRLSWEFFKYLDGLKDEAWWHRGRCLSYGEGVAYWALAEMVRTRAQILEGEDQAAARDKLAACVAEFVTDPDERAWVGPRLANLLGLEERADTDRQDLFAAWRLFFERMSDRGPVIMVFEDLQWADQALLAFIEYLLEWSSSQRLYVLALARPDFAEQQPEFGRAIRNVASIALEPLADSEMVELLDGYVPGLSADVRAQVLERAQGVPLYAVETVRMLLDRGLVVRDGAVYRPAGEIARLEVPETLHALAAARLDGLPAEERSLVQHVCVLGKTFTKQAAAALVGRTEAELEPLLAGLVRKEVLSLQADPRWPERGQYGFLQELLRQVAYETLSRRDRKARHLAAVDALEQTFQGAEQDVPEVLAAHLLAAADAAPEDPDVTAIRARAAAALVQAGERAAALAAPEEGQRHFDQAASLAADDPSARAELLERAGRLAYLAGDMSDARERLEQAIAVYEERSLAEAAVRAGVALADVDVGEGRLDEAAARFEAALPALEQAGPSFELAAALSQLGRMQALQARYEPALANLERALQLAEELTLDEIFASALVSKGSGLLAQARWNEARIVLEGTIAFTRERELHGPWSRAMNNLAVLLERSDCYEEAIALTDQLAADAKQRGNRERLAAARFGPVRSLFELGRWQEALARVEEAGRVQASQWSLGELIHAACILCEQGSLEAARQLYRGHAQKSDDPEHTVSAAGVEARILRSEGRAAEALDVAERALAVWRGRSTSAALTKRAMVEALEAAVALDDLARADELLAHLDSLPPGALTPLLRGHRARFHARVDARRGVADTVDRDFRLAGEELAACGLVFDLAVTRLEHAEWLAGEGRADDAEELVAAARATFEQLGAVPWLERADRLTSVPSGA